jgi:hypothetical protein
VVLISLEAKAKRVRHGIVQAVEPFVQPVVTEVVAEVTDLDMPAVRRRLRAMPECVEQAVPGAGFMVEVVAECIAEFVTELLVAQAHIVSFGFVRAEPKSVVVPAVLWIVHSHDVHGPPAAPACPGLQRSLTP